MRFLIWLLVGYLLYRMVRGHAAPKITKESTGTETFQDPVCGVYVSESDAVVGILEGKRYYFCSGDCLKQFEKTSSQR